MPPPQIHHVEPDRRTLHGHFSPDLPPILTARSGDTVVFRTLDSGWNLDTEGGPKFEPRASVLDDGHCLCGPVRVEGAEPGMTLAVRFDEILPAPAGFCFAGGWPTRVNDFLDIAGVEYQTVHRWTLDREEGLGRNQYGHTVRLRPFLGVVGLAPAEPGIHSTTPPRTVGGNIDCKELIAGTTLYLPVAVPGALLSLGDGHGTQGDGEVSGLAIECAMERVVVTLDLLPDLHLSTPRAETAEGWLTFGFHEDLNEAAHIALEAMLVLMAERFGLARTHALALASLVVDLRITQIVNGVRGVHAVLPHDAISGLAPARL